VERQESVREEMMRGEGAGVGGAINCLGKQKQLVLLVPDAPNHPQRRDDDDLITSNPGSFPISLFDERK